MSFLIYKWLCCSHLWWFIGGTACLIHNIAVWTLCLPSRKLAGIAKLSVSCWLVLVVCCCPLVLEIQCVWGFIEFEQILGVLPHGQNTTHSSEDSKQLSHFSWKCKLTCQSATPMPHQKVLQASTLWIQRLQASDRSIVFVQVLMSFVNHHNIFVALNNTWVKWNWSIACGLQARCYIWPDFKGNQQVDGKKV